MADNLRHVYNVALRRSSEVLKLAIVHLIKNVGHLLLPPDIWPSPAENHHHRVHLPTPVRKPDPNTNSGLNNITLTPNRQLYFITQH